MNKNDKKAFIKFLDAVEINYVLREHKNKSIIVASLKKYSIDCFWFVNDKYIEDISEYLDKDTLQEGMNLCWHLIGQPNDLNKIADMFKDFLPKIKEDNYEYEYFIPASNIETKSIVKLK